MSSKIIPWQSGSAMRNNFLSREKIQFYRRNGYLILSDFINNDLCDQITKIYGQNANENFDVIRNLDRTEASIRNIMKNSRIVSALEQLQNTELVGLSTQFSFKKAGRKSASEQWNPHQDNAYVCAPYGAFISIILVLEDSDVENGCLYVLPESHFEDILEADLEPGIFKTPNTSEKNTLKTLRVHEKYLNEYKVIDLTLKKGSAVILHGNVIHGSYPNTSIDRSRMSLLITYINKGASFYPGKTTKREPIELR